MDFLENKSEKPSDSFNEKGITENTDIKFKHQTTKMNQQLQNQN